MRLQRRLSMVVTIAHGCSVSVVVGKWRSWVCADTHPSNHTAIHPLSHPLFMHQFIQARQHRLDKRSRYLQSGAMWHRLIPNAPVLFMHACDPRPCRIHADCMSTANSKHLFHSSARHLPAPPLQGRPLIATLPSLTDSPGRLTLTDTAVTSPLL